MKCMHNRGFTGHMKSILKVIAVSTAMLVDKLTINQTDWTKLTILSWHVNAMSQWLCVRVGDRWCIIAHNNGLQNEILRACLMQYNAC